MKGADHVFTKRVVDAGLAAHWRIHLSKQSGRHLNKANATHEASRSKPSHVTNDSTAQGNQHGLAIGTKLQEIIKNKLKVFPVLVGLAIRQDDRSNRLSKRVQGLGQALSIEWGNRSVTDNIDNIYIYIYIMINNQINEFKKFTTELNNDSTKKENFINALTNIDWITAIA